MVDLDNLRNGGTRCDVSHKRHKEAVVVRYKYMLTLRKDKRLLVKGRGQKEKGQWFSWKEKEKDKIKSKEGN